MKKIPQIFLPILLSFSLSGVLLAEAPVADLKLPTKKFLLDNGLTVLISEMPSSPVVAVYGYVKAGSTTEGKWLGAGLSHFMEHMLFKGTDKRGVGQISQEIQAIGGTINASTSFDYTVYTLEVPSEAADQALDVLADMLMHSRFEPQEIEKEREVVYGEIHMHNDNPDRALSEAVFRTVYTRHPYRLPVIGFEELLRQVDQGVFKEYYDQQYIPNNIVLSVAGNVRGDEILPKIKEIFKDFQRKPYVMRGIEQEPEQISPRWDEEEFPTELTRMSMSYASVSILDPDVYALDVLALILGQGESSRLYQDVFKRRQLVRSISTYNYTPVDRGLFEVDCTLDEEKVQQAIGAVKENIRAIQDKGVKPAELEKAKRQFLSSFISSFQSAGGVAMTTAMDEAYTGDYAFAEKYVAAIQKITAQDIQRVALRYLVDSRLSVVILKPAKPKPVEEKPQSSAEANEIQEVRLSNGLRVLLKSDPTLPLITLRLSMKGALMEEPVELNGVSNLTAMLWTKGTRARSADQIAEDVESRGAGLDASSGRNSISVSLQVLAQDLPFALDLLEDLVKNPAFSEAELVKEKEKVKTAILALNDDIVTQTSRSMRQDLFAGHPLSRDEVGTVETVNRITVNDIRSFFTRLKDPANMVLAVFGDINRESLEQELTRRFGALPAGNFVPATHEVKSVPAPVEKTIRLDKKQAMVMIGFQGSEITADDRAGLTVLSEILGSPFSGRVFTRVREEFGNAYALGGGYNPAISSGVLYFYALTTDEAVLTVKDRILAILNEIRNNKVPDQEVVDIKRYIIGRYQMNLETIGSQAMSSTLDELYGLGFSYYKKYPDLINQVTAEEVLRLAQKYLDPQHQVIVLARPKQIEAGQQQ